MMLFNRNIEPLRTNNSETLIRMCRSDIGPVWRRTAVIGRSRTVGIGQVLHHAHAEPRVLRVVQRVAGHRTLRSRSDPAYVDLDHQILQAVGAFAEGARIHLLEPAADIPGRVGPAPDADLLLIRRARDDIWLDVDDVLGRLAGHPADVDHGRRGAPGGAPPAAPTPP